MYLGAFGGVTPGGLSLPLMPIIGQAAAPTITITEILTQVADFYFGMFNNIILRFLTPAAGSSVLSPLQVLMWAGLLLGFLLALWAFTKGSAKA